MPDLELSDFELDIRSYVNGFRYHIMFRFAKTRKVFSGEGTAPSPEQCFDMAMAYLSDCVREAA